MRSKRGSRAILLYVSPIKQVAPSDRRDNGEAPSAQQSHAKRKQGGKNLTEYSRFAGIPESDTILCAQFFQLRHHTIGNDGNT